MSNLPEIETNNNPNFFNSHGQINNVLNNTSNQNQNTEPDIFVNINKTESNFPINNIVKNNNLQNDVIVNPFPNIHINDGKLQETNGQNIINNYNVNDDNINKNKLQVKIQQNEMNIN